MNHIRHFLLALIPAVGLTACGGGDTADRLDLANPALRFVHAAPDAPNLTLSRNAVAQPDETSVAYKFALIVVGCLVARPLLEHDDTEAGRRELRRHHAAAGP